MSGWTGIDLDGTLAHYDEWRGPGHIGAPITPMVARVQAMLEAGEDVRIFTARVSGAADLAGRTSSPGCQVHLGRVLPVTCEKDYGCKEIWDDRAVQVIPNTGEIAQDFFTRVEQTRADTEAGAFTHLNCATCGAGKRHLVSRLAEESQKAARLQMEVSRLTSELLNLQRRIDGRRRHA